MQIVKNETLIKRNARIGQVAMIAGLAVLGAGLFISFRMQERFDLSILALFLGFLLSQIGIYYSNRWGRKPRPSDMIDAALKGLDNKYTLYHYETPASHLLVGPAGVWVLLPRHQRGEISFAKGRYHQKGGNLYLKLFAQEGIGRPDLEILSESDRAESYLNKRLSPEAVPPLLRAIVFTNPQATLKFSEDDQLPAETVSSGKLKDLIRKSAKSAPLSMEKIQLVKDAIEKD